MKKHLVIDKILQHCMFIEPKDFLQGMTCGVRAPFSVNDTTRADDN